MNVTGREAHTSMHVSRRLAWCLLVAAGSLAACAAPSRYQREDARLTIKVVDEVTGMPLEGVTIVQYHNDSVGLTFMTRRDIEYQFVTDSSGVVTSELQKRSLFEFSKEGDRMTHLSRPKAHHGRYAQLNADVSEHHVAVKTSALESDGFITVVMFRQREHPMWSGDQSSVDQKQ